MDFSLPLLNKGGSFVTKVFQGRGIEAVVEAAKLNFSKVQRFSPVASRNSSSETYLVCKNKLPRTRGKDGDFSVRDYVEASLAKDGFVTSEDESDSEVSGKIGFTLHRARDD